MSVLHQRAKDVFLAALERPPAERAAFLRAACGDDETLLREAESLLATEGFLKARDLAAAAKESVLAIEESVRAAAGT